MFCQSCGKPIENTSKFCLHCGAQIGAPASSVAPAQLAYAPAMDIYAGFWKRFAARLVDGIILSSISSVFIFAMRISLLNSKPNDPAIFTTIVKIAAIAMIVSIIVVWLYHAIMESSEKQATFGKMALGIKVTDKEGQRISFWRATGRHFAEILSGLTLYVGYIMAGFTSRKQALHDMMANTLVVNRDIQPEQLRLAPTATGGMSNGTIVALVLGVTIIPLIAIIGILAAIAIPAYQDYTVRAKMAGAVAYGHTATLAVEEYYRSHNAVPASLEEAGISSPSGPNVRDAYINPTNGIITLSMNFKPIEGEKLMFVPDEDGNGKITWTCRSDDIKEKYLPKECR